MTPPLCITALRRRGPTIVHYLGTNNRTLCNRTPLQSVASPAGYPICANCRSIAEQKPAP